MQLEYKYKHKIFKKKRFKRKTKTLISLRLINKNYIGIKSVKVYENGKRRVNPYKYIDIGSHKIFIRNIDKGDGELVPWNCINNNVHFRGTNDIIASLNYMLGGKNPNDVIDEGMPISYRRERDLKISKKADSFMSCSGRFNKGIKSYKAFIRYCKKQNVPNGTKFIFKTSLVKGKDITYTHKMKKMPEGRCLYIQCWKCQSALLLRNLARSYDTIKCGVDRTTIIARGKEIY